MFTSEMHLPTRNIIQKQTISTGKINFLGFQPMRTKKGQFDALFKITQNAFGVSQNINTEIDQGKYFQVFFIYTYRWRMHIYDETEFFVKSLHTIFTCIYQIIIERILSLCNVIFLLIQVIHAVFFIARKVLEISC